MLFSTILTTFRTLRIKHLHSQQTYRFYNTIFEKNTVYLTQKSEEKNVEIRICYENRRFGIDKVFAMVRNENERIGVCLEELRSKVEKELAKISSKQRGEKNFELNSHENQESPKVSIKMVYDGGNITEHSLVELRSKCDYTKLYIFDEPLDVTFNLPWISSVALPSLILTNCIVYPITLNMQYSNPKETTFKWYKGKKMKDESSSMTWTEIGDESTYSVKLSDVGCKLKLVCTPRNGEIIGPSVECVSKSVVKAGPRQYLFENRHSHTTNRLPRDEFRVVSYNLLADMHASSASARTTLFPYCPPYALDIDYRKQLFLKEILGYNGDIICVQEVDNKVFDTDLAPFLDMNGYSGTFKAKAPTTEGLATFYNCRKFSLVESYGLNIGENVGVLDVFEDLWKKIEENSQFVKKFIRKSTAFQINTLKANDKIVIVANTHLFFRSNGPHIRLLQTAFIMKYVEYVYNRTRQELNVDEDNISIIFCGDFNSVPESGVVKLMLEQYVGDDFIDFRSNEAEAVKNVSLSQPFKFKSAYEVHPKYTNYTLLFAACVDYIFYQATNLRVMKTIPLPSEKMLKSRVAIPSITHPSDHVALVADFKWIK